MSDLLSLALGHCRKLFCLLASVPIFSLTLSVTARRKKANNRQQNVCDNFQDKVTGGADAGPLVRYDGQDS